MRIKCVHYVAASVTLIASTFVSVGRAANDMESGKTVFELKCQKCHGDDGRGNSSMAKLLKLKQPFTPLGNAEVQSKSDEELKRIAINGVITARAEMKPVKGGLTDAQAAAVVNYLRTLKR